MHRVALAWFLGLLTMAGCQPDLAECASATQADRVVFLADGTPMFAGQALLHVSCASGTCHDSNADDRGRNGAPGRLNFDVDPACNYEVEDCDTVEEGFERLAHSASKVRDFDREILRTLLDDSMPPNGELASDLEVFETFEDGMFSNPLPAITTPEGREIVSEWLGCGSRVIEVARLPEDPSRDVPGFRCDDDEGGVFCAYAAVLEPPDPQWGGETGIYQRAIVNLGCLSCHRDDDNPNWGPDDQELDLCLSTPPEEGDCDPDAVLASLVGQAATGYASDCGDITVGNHIVANDADNSFFFSKLGPTPDCGGPMPDGSDNGIPSDFLAPIAEWINAGAMP